MKILFQGDSITDGNRYKDEESRWDKNHQIGHSYVYIITGLLGLKHPERDYEFINRGISGNRVRELEARWQEDALDINPDVLSILVGVNDANHPFDDEINDTGCEKYEKSYRSILQKSREQNPNLKIVLLESFTCEDVIGETRASAEIRVERLKSIQKIVRKLAKEFDAIFIPLSDVFKKAIESKNARYWLWDGVHPTEAGHALIAREFLDKTKSIFDSDVNL